MAGAATGAPRGAGTIRGASQSRRARRTAIWRGQSPRGASLLERIGAAGVRTVNRIADSRTVQRVDRALGGPVYTTAGVSGRRTRAAREAQAARRAAVWHGETPERANPLERGAAAAIRALERVGASNAVRRFDKAVYGREASANAVVEQERTVREHPGLHVPSRAALAAAEIKRRTEAGPGRRGHAHTAESAGTTRDPSPGRSAGPAAATAAGRETAARKRETGRSSKQQQRTAHGAQRTPDAVPPAPIGGRTIQPGGGTTIPQPAQAPTRARGAAARRDRQQERER